MPTQSSSSKTGHEGFDFWMDEYTNCIQELEDCLHVRCTTPSITNSKKQQDVTFELLNRAKKILKSLDVEAQTVPEDDDDTTTLRQELVDIYRACEMQLETYECLCRRTDLFQQTTTTTTTTTRSTPSEATLRSSLFATTTNAAILKNNTSGNNNNNNQQRQDRPQGADDAVKGRVLKQNSNIQAALSSIKETEQVAMEITGELNSQRGRLEQTKGNLSELSSMTQRAKTLLKSMNTPWWQKW